VTAGMCRLTTLHTGLLYILEIFISLHGRSATGRIISMTSSEIEFTSFKLLAHRLKGRGPDKLRVFQEFETPKFYDSRREKVINLTILRTGRFYVRY
jgi:hypothetical protein